MRNAPESSTFRGLVALPDTGRSVYAEYRAARAGAPTLTLLNGLSETTADWQAFSHQMGGDVGLLKLDFRGQGRSLREELRQTGRFDAPVGVDEQVEDVRLLVEHFGVPKPIDLVGFSYGGGVSLRLAETYPQHVRRLILLVPYLIRLDQAFHLQRVWASQFRLLRGLSPGPAHAADCLERLYEQFLVHYMEHRYQNVLLDREARAAAIQLSLGIMRYDAFPSLRRLPPGSLHLLSACRDTLVPRGLYGEMWDKTPPRIRASWLSIEDGEHLLLSQAPAYCARWVTRILNEDPRLQGGRRFRGRACAFEVEDELRHRLDLNDPPGPGPSARAPG